jgi:hypothetical protein
MLSSLSYGFVLPAAAPRTSASRPMMLSPNGDELATMYRQRWASAEAAPSSGYTYEFATEEFEVQEPACITHFDKQAKMKKNTCGKTSFDSFDGMTCVEEPASGKWVCQ